MVGAMTQSLRPVEPALGADGGHPGGDLPTAADFDRLEADLDRVDAVLAELDQDH